MPAQDTFSASMQALPYARTQASAEATLTALLHVLDELTTEAEDIGLGQTAAGLGAIARFAVAEYQARHGVQN